jgi:FkbM family methyltransferase
MTSLSNIANRIISSTSSACRGAIWQMKVNAGKPILFHLPDGTVVRLHPEGQIPELLFTHNFEFTELSLCSRVWQKGTNVIDIGANIGLYSIFASAGVGSSGRVYSFEPSSESRSRLMRNLSLNGCSNVVVSSSAVADRSASNALLVRENGFKDGDRYLQIDLTSARDLTADHEEVHLCTLDEWSAAVGHPAIAFMKVDVEGGELAVFRGGSEFFSRNKDLVIMFECNLATCERAGYSQDELLGLLQKAGFGLYAWDKQTSSWVTEDAKLKRAGNVWASKFRNALPVI